MLELDRIDQDMLRLLQADGRMTGGKLAEKLALSESPSWRRQKRLEADGYIEGYQAIVSRKKLGLGVLAFVRLSVAEHSESVLTKIEMHLAAHQNVLSCHKVSGDADYLVQIVAKDLDEYGRFFTSIFSDLPGIATLHSNLSLQEVKATSQLPIY
ncbi:AsnC family transcriptional regulator [Paraburkholderia acidicola]|uniref:AsnC family transcriptional regulator n=1 Tax=Paraburkholderia acidicola TaxID=1912599 RepID=A0A2A4ERP8_9BURK|nr:Lrp/AsnC family transcriptional regulator [Paraburkholderia acidicola]PCE22836.1 AsnC family transcriptional regulator [Paraburkholderia acidicola]